MDFLHICRFQESRTPRFGYVVAIPTRDDMKMNMENALQACCSVALQDCYSISFHLRFDYICDFFSGYRKFSKRFIRSFMNILKMWFWDYQRMPILNLSAIKETYEKGILIDFPGIEFSRNNLAENTVASHGPIVMQRELQLLLDEYS